MSSMRRVISLGFTFLLATPVISALPTGDGWQEMETENFIVFSNLDDSATKEIGLDLERLQAVLEEIFPRAEFDSPLDTLIFIFKDRESFEPYALPGGQSGYFAPHKHANFAAVVGSRPSDTLPVVYRQYLHDVVNNNVPQVPLWFKHGLAEIFSTFQADGSMAQVALPDRRRRRGESGGSGWGTNVCLGGPGHRLATHRSQSDERLRPGFVGADALPPGGR